MQHYGSFFNIRNLSVCVLVLLCSILATAQHGELIYSFGSNTNDGSDPTGALIADTAGNLYGTTALSGAACCGTVFELSPPVSPGSAWTETVLYSFLGGADGVGPMGSLVFDAVGNLYGVTNVGGNPNCFTGCGTVFELNPPATRGGSWTKTTIYSFSGSDGAGPYGGGLVFDQSGNLYGTTEIGGNGLGCGSDGCGTVFKLSPPAAPGGVWTESILYSFTGGGDGAVPRAPVVFDSAGNLYGTANEGGNENCLCGTVFELTPSGGGWNFTVLHTFFSFFEDGTSPGYGPLLVDKTGDLVGTTIGGGIFTYGTVYGLRPPSSRGAKRYGVLYNFGSTPTDGVSPQSSVTLLSGKLYGTTEDGGSNAVGTIFQLTRTKGEIWSETDSYSFTGGLDGGHPLGGMLLYKGVLYGTAGNGGRYKDGTVFKIILQ